MIVLLASTTASAQQSSASFRPVGARIERLAAGPLGILGFATIPGGPASDIRIERGQNGSTGLLLGQLGTGFTLSDSFPLYLEGSIGYTRSGLYLQRVRLMAQAVVGEDVRGWSVGLGISF